MARSNNFPGGPVTSCWVTWRAYWASIASKQNFGLCASATNSAGLYIGNNANASQCTLYTYNGTTMTQIAVETGASIGNTGAGTLPHKMDMQIINYGASATSSRANCITSSGDA